MTTRKSFESADRKTNRPYKVRPKRRASIEYIPAAWNVSVASWVRDHHIFEVLCDNMYN